ncbi:hypothetical protein LSAT2_004763 [Lamellibrachia satsuma]|nr:hypothetical protein LSAT2_004763 [Lamellibrachia satsuma]
MFTHAYVDVNESGKLISNFARIDSHACAQQQLHRGRSIQLASMPGSIQQHATMKKEGYERTTVARVTTERGGCDHQPTARRAYEDKQQSRQFMEPVPHKSATDIDC